MNGMQIAVGVVLPYVALATFVAGVVHRWALWSRVPQPGKMTLYPTRGWGYGAGAREVLFLPSLYRGDRPLWLLSWSFHIALAVAFIGHFRAVTGLIDRAFAALGLGARGMAAISAVAGGAAGVVLLVGVTLLLFRRLLLPRAREISRIPDFVALLLLTAVITSGNLLRFGGSPADLDQTRAWVGSLLTLSPVVPESPALLAHVFCGELVILYLAWSKLMHFGGIFLALPLVRRT